MVVPDPAVFILVTKSRYIRECGDPLEPGQEHAQTAGRIVFPHMNRFAQMAVPQPGLSLQLRYDSQGSAFNRAAYTIEFCGAPGAGNPGRDNFVSKAVGENESHNGANLGVNLTQSMPCVDGINSRFPGLRLVVLVSSKFTR